MTPGGQTQQPGYAALHRSGELGRRADQAYRSLEQCHLCPRACGVNRLRGELGYCKAGLDPMVASWNAHIWEEPPISGPRGSGTIFFSHCTAGCLFCQNYPISQLGVGQVVSSQRLAGMMLELAARQCHNINLVTPTQYVPQILAALDIAAGEGLELPLVYNSSGYDAPETLRWLQNVVDVYLPDAKYAEDDIAEGLSGFVSYVSANRAALNEMHRQVGARLTLDSDGCVRSGLIIRHLVLPEGLAGTDQVLQWISRELSPRVHVSLMSQYFPAHKAVGHPVLGRPLTFDEYVQALEAFDRAGLEAGWRQTFCGEDW